MLDALVLRTFVQYSVAFCSRPETASDVMSGKFVGPTVHDKCVKFRDSRSDHSRDIRLPHFATNERQADHRILRTALAKKRQLQLKLQVQVAKKMTVILWRWYILGTIAYNAKVCDQLRSTDAKF